MNLRVNFRNLVRQMLPAHKRQPGRLFLFRRLISPLDGVFSGFERWRDDIRIQINMTGQIGVLQGYLRAKYNSTGIRIENYPQTGLAVGLRVEGVSHAALVGMRDGVVGPAPIPESSYYIDTDGVMWPFSASDTPTANFCTSNGATAKTTINGRSVIKNTIARIVFGAEYSPTTSLQNHFLRNFTALISVDFSAFFNVWRLGQFFLANCAAMTSIDLSAFANVVSIDDYFLYSGRGLVAIQIGSINWSSATISSLGLMQNMPNTSTSALMGDSQEVIDAFKAKFPRTSTWSVIINDAAPATTSEEDTVAVPLRGEIELQFDDADFVIYVPATYSDRTIDDIRRDVNRYKQALVKYKIEK